MMAEDDKNQAGEGESPAPETAAPEAAAPQAASLSYPLIQPGLSRPVAAICEGRG